MTARTSVQALAEVTAALVREHDLADVLARLVQDGAALLDVDAAAVLVTSPSGALEVLSATSHSMEELELYQAQVREGPCVEAMSRGEHVSALGAAELQGRWSDVGPAIVAAGFRGVHGFPLRFLGRPLGGLNLFRRSERPMTDDEAVLAQSLADVASLALVQPGHADDDEVRAQIGQALHGRIVIEQAKGVLAEVLGLDMARAYDELRERADGNGNTLTEAARGIIAGAQRPMPA